MLKRGLSVFLAAALMLLCFFCVPAFAAEPEFDISEYTIDDLKKCLREKSLICYISLKKNMDWTTMQQAERPTTLFLHVGHLVILRIKTTLYLTWKLTN